MAVRVWVRVGVGVGVRGYVTGYGLRLRVRNRSTDGGELDRAALPRAAVWHEARGARVEAAAHHQQHGVGALIRVRAKVRVRVRGRGRV